MALHPALLLLALALCIACLTPGAAAFGAGEIPEYAHKAGIAYRHGTIENILETLAKSASGGGAGRLLIGVAGALLSGNAGELGNAVSGKGTGSKFSGLDVKRVYFGNWLRDYSQACDIAGLSKLSIDSIVLLIMCLGFSAFGYATGEFEITKEKLGVYLCVEHIDNPKGYGEGTDARQYDPRLRGPVEDRELEIDPQNGMKRYIASEGQGFDTSAACIRGHLRRCIELGRQGGDQNRFEAYRELGTALHTLEDFLAHSNYLELALNKLGHRDVFCHVGDNVRVRAPNGQNVPPIVTGTFGGNDFIVSVLGEVGDKLSSATVNDLNTKFSDAKTQGNQQQGGAIQLIKTFMGSMPSGGGGGEGDDKKQNVNQQLENVEQIRKNAINIDPSKLASAEVQKIFIDVLTTRDNIFKNVEQLLEMFGLDEKIDELGNALAVLVLTTLEPYVLPIIRSVTEGLAAGSAAMLQKEDQLIVFNDDNASDPTHSVLSKDHFDLWLNQPAGMVAIDVVKHTVPLIVQAWSDNSNPDDAINIILQAIHHPYWLRDECAIQKRMLETVRSWIDSLDQSERNKILQSLTKESVKAGNNKREDSESYGTLGHRCSGGAGHGHHVGGGAGASSAYHTGTMGSGGNHRLATGNRITGNPAQTTFGGQSTGSGAGGMGLAGGFGGMQQGIGQAMEQRHSGNQEEQSSNTAFGTQSGFEASQGRQSGYGRQDDDDGRGSSRYSRNEQGRQDYDSHRDSDNRRYNQESSGYSRPPHQSGYGGDVDEERTAYNRPARHEYGQSRNDDDEHRQQYGRDEGRHEPSYGRHDERDNLHSQYSGGGNRRHDDDDNNNRERYGRDNDYGGQGRRHDNDSNEFGRQYGNAYQQNRRNDDQTDYASRMGRMNLGSDEGRSQYGTGRGDDDYNRDQYGSGGYHRQQDAGESRFRRHDEDNNRYGGNDRQQTRYGRGGDDDDDNDGRRRHDDDDERRDGRSYGGYNDGRRSDNDDGNRPSYGQSSYGQSGYGQSSYRRDAEVSQTQEKPHKHLKAKSDSEDDDSKKQLKKQEKEMKKYSKKKDGDDDDSDDEKSRKTKDKKHGSDSSDEKDKKAKKRDSYDQQKRYYAKHDDDHKKYERKQKKKGKHAGSSTEDSD